MNAAAWDRFLRYAHLVLARPRFDEGSRDWKPGVAAEVRALLGSDREPDPWIAALDSTVPALQDFRDYRYDLPTPRQANWLKRWARMDPATLWPALEQFTVGGDDPVERFDRFARGAQEAPEEVRASNGGIIVMGSLFNFSLAPESLPIVRPGPFVRVEEALGVDPKAGASLVDVYANHLEFATRVSERMQRDGLPVRDMIDVQSLIVIAGYEKDYWAVDEPEAVRIAREREHAATQGTPYLSICAIYRNEAENLREWIEFHRLVGVERFFLYDNRSTDDHLDVLGPYIDKGIVVHHDWPLFPGQFEAYDHCLTHHREDSRWIAMQDVDEFLFSPDAATIPEVLVDYEQHPAVGVNIMMFGTSGHRTRPPGLLVEEYLRRDAMPWPFIKNIVDPMRTARCVNAHTFAYAYRTAVDENHQPIGQNPGRTQFTSVSRLRLNHYYLKSEEEARAKLARPMAIGGFRPHDFETLSRELNAESDETILRYLPALREALASLTTS
jgi:hypothetical protein